MLQQTTASQKQNKSITKPKQQQSQQTQKQPSQDLDVTEHENGRTVSCLVCSCMHVQQNSSAARGGCTYIRKHTTTQVPALDSVEHLLYKMQEFTFFSCYRHILLSNTLMSCDLTSLNVNGNFPPLLGTLINCS